jgi:RNA polymerase sigma factor (TIGR02999 family)
MAHEKPGQTLQPTALVHEAFIRLVATDEARMWDSRHHFFAAAAEAMRRIMVENARRKRRVRHGGTFQRVHVQVDELPGKMSCDELLALDEALDQLKEHCPVKARLVVLHFFGGMTMKQAADVLQLSRATAHRYWVYARAWLFRQIAQNAAEDTA